MGQGRLDDVLPTLAMHDERDHHVAHTELTGEVFMQDATYHRSVRRTGFEEFIRED